MAIEPPPLPEGASIENYHTFVQALDLATIQVSAIHCERLKPGDAPTTNYTLGVDLAIENGRAYYRVDGHAAPLGEDGEPVAQIQVSVLVAFDLPPDGTPPDWVLTRFGSQNAAMIAYPFVRETIASMALRIGLPGIILPMAIKRPADAADDPVDEESSGTFTDQS